MHVLRPMRVDVKNNTFIHYEGMTAADSAKSGAFCSMWLNRLIQLGMITQNHTLYGLDVLDENGDIITEHNLTKGGFDYLRRSWKFRVVKDKYVVQKDAGHDE